VGLVTGAGVGALLSVPGQDPSKSNVVLTAPHGTVDAGAAGIRVAGNLNIVALQVLNTFNIQVGGSTTGLAVAQGPPVAALTTASNATAATQQAVAAPTQNNDRPSIIIVEVLGYGGGSSDTPDKSDEERRSKPQGQQTYNTNSPYQVLGVGALTDDQVAALAAEKRTSAGRP
jgi:hypothetical protein